MNIALFGGTFDPIHLGHIAVAHAAMADPRFHLDQVRFVPAELPPFKQNEHITPFDQRFAMIALALQEAAEPRFVASRMEAPVAGRAAAPNYSIQTVRRFKASLKPEDKLFFIAGIDAFQDIAKWREPDALLRECRFIAVSRPGYSMGNALAALPASFMELRANIFLLESVHADISSTRIREAIHAGASLNALVPNSVADYIRQHGLYH